MLFSPQCNFKSILTSFKSTNILDDLFFLNKICVPCYKNLSRNRVDCSNWMCTCMWECGDGRFIDGRQGRSRAIPELQAFLKRWILHPGLKQKLIFPMHKYCLPCFLMKIESNSGCLKNDFPCYFGSKRAECKAHWRWASSGKKVFSEVSLKITGVKLGVPLYWSKTDWEGPPTDGKINTTPHRSQDVWAR